MKCEICTSKIEKTFLDKVIGTYVKDKEGKRHLICFECQSKFNSKSEVLAQL